MAMFFDCGFMQTQVLILFEEIHSSKKTHNAIVKQHYYICFLDNLF